MALWVFESSSGQKNFVLSRKRRTKKNGTSLSGKRTDNERGTVGKFRGGLLRDKADSGEIESGMFKDSGSHVDVCQSEKSKSKDKKKKKVRTEDKNLTNKNLDAEKIIIKELIMGEPGGKIANRKRKVTIMFTGWQKGFEEYVEMDNCFKFRLGDKEIIKGFNVGVEGMCVGGKRRLILASRMGCWRKKETDPEIVYDVELVSVR